MRERKEKEGRGELSIARKGKINKGMENDNTLNALLS